MVNAFAQDVAMAQVYVFEQDAARDIGLFDRNSVSDTAEDAGSKLAEGVAESLEFGPSSWAISLSAIPRRERKTANDLQQREHAEEEEGLKHVASWVTRY